VRRSAGSSRLETLAPSSQAAGAARLTNVTALGTVRSNIKATSG
jgi:hypothetical protein